MRNKTEISFRDLRLIPNLFSLLRILLTPFIGYFLSINTPRSIIVSVIFLAAAGITDFLDGFLARRLNQITPLGIILDPVADKIFTMALIVELTYFRGFPIWLAIAIVARDFLIMLAGLKILKSRRIELPSNLTGKYYFATLSLLIFSYIVHFPFGEKIFFYIGILLLIMSGLNYARIFFVARRGGQIPVFADKPVYKYARLLITILVVILGLYMFYFEVVTGYIQ